MAELSEFECQALPLLEAGGLPRDLKVMQGKVAAAMAETEEPVLLVGLSLGAMLALSFLAQPPANLVGVVSSAGQFNLKGNLFYKLQRFLFKIMPAKTFQARGLDKAELISFYDSLASFDLTPWLTETACPVLALCGEKDKANLKTSQDLVKLVPSGRFVMISDAGHELNATHPVQMADQIRQFIARLPI